MEYEVTTLFHVFKLTENLNKPKYNTIKKIKVKCY